MSLYVALYRFSLTHSIIDELKLYSEYCNFISISNEPELNELRTRVDTTLLKKFEQLKSHYGITETSEILRLLIVEMYRRTIEKDDEIEKLKKEFRAEIRRLREELKTP